MVVAVTRGLRVSLCMLSTASAIGLVACGDREDQLVGNWRDVNGTERLEFFDDHRVTIADRRRSIAGSWTVLRDGRVKIEATTLGTTVVFTGALRDDTLILDVQGGTSRYTRDDTPTVGESGDNERREGPARPAPATTSQGAGAGGACSADRVDSERRRLNVFVSNFAEAAVQPFERGNISQQALIEFGVRHNIINAPRRIQRSVDSDTSRLAAREVESAVRRYFDITSIQHQQLTGRYSWIVYNDGQYSFVEGAGEPRPFAQVDSVSATPNGELNAYLTTYVIPDIAADVYGTPVATLRCRGIEVTRQASFRALVKEVPSQSGQRYVLVAYSGVRASVPPN